ncbi:hypothetical protein GDO78_018493 [Eleutherodactylus coqui]|uniref:Nucleolar protein 9 n=1 Tax=Eleutherodactylus coqui TaxID=57060 RepID=A0A8J6BKI7_ELECQ|nr:hypothetical protein GDO78_018493 [Eleutherodactylus coqui]
MTMDADHKKSTGKKRAQQGGKSRPSSSQQGQPPKRQKKDTEKSATEQSKKGPSDGPPPRLDPKSVGYFRRVGETLQQDFESKDDRALFVRNVFNEVKGIELLLATDASGSIVLQKLLSVAASAQLCQVLDALSKTWQNVCWHRSGAHVVQTALLQYERLQNPEVTEEEEEEEGESDSCSSLEDLVLSLCSEVRGNFLPYNQNTHGSFIVRTLLQVLSGTVLDQDASKRGGRGSAVKSEFDVPPSFLQQLEEMCGLFTGDIGVFATHKQASLGMQTALQVLHRKLPSTCAALCDDVISYLSSRNVSGDGSALMVFLKDETCSRLLEKILEVSEKKQLRRLFKAHFEGQLQALAAHPIANFTVQRLIRAIQTKKLDHPDIKLQFVNYHGSILLQHLLHFQDPAPVLHSLGNMTEADLHTVACSQPGSHVFDALLNSASITEKQRKKVLRKLRAHCMELACNKYGSRVLDHVWNSSTLGVKEEIAQKLGNHTSTYWGRLLYTQSMRLN